MNTTIMRIQANGVNFGEELKNIVMQDMASDEKTWMQKGVNYYKGDNDILYEDLTQTEVDQNIKRPRIPHPYLKLFIDQAAGYAVGNPVKIQFENENDEKIWNENIEEETFQKTIYRLFKRARKKGIEWLYCYVENNEFKYTIMPAEQIKPIFKMGFDDELEYVIRYYPFFKNNVKFTRIELWSKDNVEKYDYNHEAKTVSWLTTDNIILIDQNQELQETTAFSRVPFIAFQNNEENIPDIKLIKGLIDKIDHIESDEAYEFEQSLLRLLKVKNYDGQLATLEGKQALREAVKHSGIVGVANDGDLSWVSTGLNTESYQKAIESATKRLYEAAQAADLTTDKFSNASGVALKFLYTPLDLKVKNTEIEFKEALQFFVQMFNEYLEITGKQKLRGKVSFKFNHNQIINEYENTQTENLKTTTAMMLQSILPLEKVLEELPQVENVEETLKQIEEDRTNDLRNVMVSNDDN